VSITVILSQSKGHLALFFKEHLEVRLYIFNNVWCAREVNKMYTLLSEKSQVSKASMNLHILTVELSSKEFISGEGGAGGRRRTLFSSYLT
jgi:hypothetical protein